MKLVCISTFKFNSVSNCYWIDLRKYMTNDLCDYLRNQLVDIELDMSFADMLKDI